MRNDRHRHRMQYKIDTLTHYGNGKLACVKCGESRIACLSSDHINGGGELDRRGSMGQGGATFYRRLMNRNFPPGFQTLCMNCQFVKRDENKEYVGYLAKRIRTAEQELATVKQLLLNL